MSNPKDNPDAHKRPGVLHLVWIYAVLAAAWILVTDYLVTRWFTDLENLRNASITKGLLFISVTSLLLYFLLRQAASQARQAMEREHQLQTEKLNALHLLDSIASSSTDAIFAKNTHGQYLLFNRAAERNVGKLAADVLGKTDMDIFPPEEATMVMADDQHIMEQNNVLTWEHSLDTANGPRVFLTTQGPLHDADGKISGVFGIAHDITERKQAENELRKLSLAVNQSPENIIITDLAANIEFVNESFLRNTGYSREEVMGRNPRFLKSGKTPLEIYRVMWQALTSGQSWQGELYNRRKDGSEYTELAIISPVRQKDGNISHFMAIKQDITKLKLAEAEINRLAFYDPLTGLPNRALLLDRLGMVLPIVQRRQRHDALLAFNLDRFKSINDTSGQDVGDALLKAVAERLGKVLREGDVLTRLSGDEFSILLLDLAQQELAAAHQAMHVSEKIHTILREPFTAGAEQIMLTASIGIALFPVHDNDTPLDILRRANAALHQSKAAGGACTTLFEHSMDETSKQRFRIERELTLGIPAGQLRLYLQPQVSAAGKMVGAEALVRWQHPEMGLVPPGVFISIAEESDLIIEVGRWVFRQVCQLLRHENLLGRPFRISVNISPRQFRQHDFVSWVKDEIATNGTDPTRLTFEITEGVVIADIGSVIARMNELAAMGIHFSIDDFGTGYSSLAYLKRLPIQELKIDKIFVQDAPYDPDDAALVETILSVARHMHLKVVAEGVETAEQAEFLNARAAVIHQGYLYGMPEPAEKWLESLSKNNP